MIDPKEVFNNLPSTEDIEKHGYTSVKLISEAFTEIPMRPCMIIMKDGEEEKIWGWESIVEKIEEFKTM